MVELNTSSDEVHVTLSPDGLEMIFASRRPEGSGDNDLWLASRHDKSASWQAVKNLTALNTVDNDRAPIFSSDGHTLFFDRRIGGPGNARLWYAERNEENGDFENPRPIEGPVNAGGWNGLPTISPAWPADGAELYWLRCFGPECDIYVATWRNAESPRFLRGDCNGDGKLDISDPLANLSFQFVGNFDPPCRDALDFDDSGELDVTDPIANLTHQFLGGPASAPPGKDTCGVDPTDDKLTCESFAACP